MLRQVHAAHTLPTRPVFVAGEWRPRMNVEDVANELAQLGMPEDEARVWAYLRILGPSKASAVADATGLSRARTYRALKALGGHGFVRTGVGRPRIYESVDPADVFSRLHRRAEEKLQTIEAAARELRPAIRELERTRTPAMSQPRFDILRSRPTIHSHLISLFDEAGLSIDLAYGHPSAASILAGNGIVQAIKQCGAAGVAVRILLATTEAQQIRGQVDGDDHVRVRTLEMNDRGLRVTVDETTAVVTLVEGESSSARCEECVAFVTDSIDFIRAERARFDVLWSGARFAGDEEAAGRSATV